MDKLKLLQDLRFGARVAEEEADQLSRYFVETDQWSRLFSGEVDIVYGSKGSGKSALYTLLNLRADELFDRGILLSSAENPRGAQVFQGLVTDPPASEQEFVTIWKLYVLALVGEKISYFNLSGRKSDIVLEVLRESGLLPAEANITSIFRAVRSYVKRWSDRRATSIEYALSYDFQNNVPLVRRRAEFSTDSQSRQFDDIPADALLKFTDQALEECEAKIWIVFDRLDVAFSDSRDLERNALRALFRTYGDSRSLNNVEMKIFVRDDIWKRITEGGFIEASHLVKDVNILWTKEGLINLVVRRLLSNDNFKRQYSIEEEGILADFGRQHDLLRRIFPEKVDTGRNPETFEWMLGRTHDASGKNAPRELIHLLEVARDAQITRMRRGEPPPDGDLLFERAVFKEALQKVSTVRYEQTLIAEYPEHRPYLEALRGEKSEHSLTSLAKLWSVSEDKASEVAVRLHEIGFFEIRGTKEMPSFWVPFLYRHALDLVQGRA